MSVDLDSASRILIREQASANEENSDPSWLDKVKRLSQLCEEADVRTHIAFLGTAILAKCVDPKLDPRSMKSTGAPGAYSARTLCHSVLVPGAGRYKFSLGVTGREPLNNMPYFRMERLGDATRIHVNSATAFAYLRKIVDELASLTTPAEACGALRAFVTVRRAFVPVYAVSKFDGAIQLGTLISIARSFVEQQSEGGKRAQAVVAGVLDVQAGLGRVDAGRINDPSRKYPGDVCIRAAGSDRVVRSFEVRDKPVSEADALMFGYRCLKHGVRVCSVVAVARSQLALDLASISEWESQTGAELRVFVGWEPFIKEALFWAEVASGNAATEAGKAIYSRLVAIEISAGGAQLWQSLLKG
jgi:hypothetical protein